MERTYSVLYKNGRTQSVTGNIVLFSSINTEIPNRVKNAVYLNADEVVSAIEQPSVDEDRVAIEAMKRHIETSNKPREEV